MTAGFGDMEVIGDHDRSPLDGLVGRACLDTLGKDQETGSEESVMGQVTVKLALPKGLSRITEWRLAPIVSVAFQQYDAVIQHNHALGSISIST